jgi:hypothetical protein
VVVPEDARPCTKTLPTNEVVTFVKVTVLPPATVALEAIVATAVAPTVTVTVTGPGGSAPSVMPTDSCMSRPTSGLGFVSTIGGAVTVAVTVRKLLGVLNPVGGVTAMSEVPVTAGSKLTVLMNSAPLKTTGLPTIAPTPGPPVWSVAVTATVAEKPPRRVWLPCQFSVVGSSRAEVTWMVVFPENVVVLNAPGLLMMNPEGTSV